MKKALALILSLVLLLALVPCIATADGKAFELEIKGGQTNGSMTTINGADCLKVDVWLNGLDDNMLITSTGFALLYDAEQLTFETNSQAQGVSSLQLIDQDGNVSGSGSLIINPSEAGAVRIVAGVATGYQLKKDMPLITLYFRVKSSLPIGTEIGFRLASLKNNGEIILDKKPFFETILLEDLIAGKVTAEMHDTDANFKPFIVSDNNAVPIEDAKVEWNEGEVEYNGTTPYLLYDGKAKTPKYTVKDKDGNVIDPTYYDAEFRENTQAGTAYLFITFENGYSGECIGWFKIYLPASEWLTVENVENGILLRWAAVEGAAGYVIYRRAWSTTTNGWTTFERWWNVPGTSWIDGTDNHKVYAGSRYQYGVKAYFERRVDPVKNEEIGGNVNEPSGNYNLGIVSPLKTTVRITTRVLTAVTGGDKQITVNWERSKNFSGYHVELATDENFMNVVETKMIDDWTHGGTVFENLNAKTTYYARMRSYHIFEGMTYYGQWSNVLSAKTN